MYPCGPSVITRSFKCGRGRQKGQCQSDEMEERLNRPLLTLKTEERTTSQGIWSPLDAGKGKKMDSSLEHSEGL